MGMSFDLSAAEAERVSRARDAEELERVAAPAMARDRHRLSPNLERLAKVWRAMNEDERTDVRVAIAQQTGMEPDACWLIDLEAASKPDGLGAGRGGAVQLPGLRAAVLELYRLWVERGGKPSIGNRRRDEEAGRPPAPACQFVAQHLPALFPAHFGRIGDPAQREREAQVKADTQLRALRAAGTLR